MSQSSTIKIEPVEFISKCVHKYLHMYVRTYVCIIFRSFMGNWFMKLQILFTSLCKAAVSVSDTGA